MTGVASSNVAGPEWTLRCTRHRHRLAFAPLVGGCSVCHSLGARSVLEACFEPEQPPAVRSPDAGARGISRYLDLLPGGDPSSWVTLGEGDTPLIRSRVIGPELDLGHLYFKYEAMNPSGSFKDRYVVVSTNLAKRFGYRKVVVSSTGNLGVSVAAYGAALGLECLVLVLPGTPRGIVAQARLHGAKVAMAEAAHRQPVFERIAGHGEWFPIGLFLERPVQNPFGIEGYRTIAYELIESLRESPGTVLFPCARGNGLYGAWKGFVEAERWGWTTGHPRMVACQPAGANSLEVSLRQGASAPLELARIESVAFSAAETVADASALEAIRASAGEALSASDADILAAVRSLAREGVYAETASALPVACLPTLLARGIIDPGGAIVCVITGGGAKWPDQMPAEDEPTPLLSPDPRHIDRFLQGG